MAGCEKMIAEERMLTSAKSSAGSSQFATEPGAVLTSSKTSPGVAKTFSRRAPKDMAGGLGAAGGGSETDGGIGSIIWLGPQSEPA